MPAASPQRAGFPEEDRSVFHPARLSRQMRSTVAAFPEGRFLPTTQKILQDWQYLDKRTPVTLDSLTEIKSCLGHCFGRIVSEHGHDGIRHAVELNAVKKRSMDEPESSPIQWKIGFERTQGASTEVDPSSQHFETKEHAMLVLSRKLNEKIVIDGGIVVTVVKIDRNQVRLGIEGARERADFPRGNRRRRRPHVIRATR